MNNLYDCGCSTCQAKKETLNLGISDSFKNLLNVAEKAFKQLHKNEGYKPEDLKTEKVYQDLLEQTFSIFDSAIQDNVVPEVMKAALQSDAFMVAGLKTHAQLFEASTLLMNKDGSLKSYAALENDLKKLNVKYNATYLESEYQFATGSATMADKWDSFDDTGRYNLQYRTANDNRVRDEHAALADTTLPKSDPFWDNFYPPNGWRCFLPETLILTDIGWKQIQHIKQKEWLIGGSGYMKFVEAVHTNPFNGNLVTLFAKGKQISCTPNHRFFTSMGWIASECINVGDIIVQVGKVGFFNKIMNAIHNSKALVLYGLMSFKRKRKTV